MARKHAINWVQLLAKATLRIDGEFFSRAGGSILCDGRLLLKQLVRLEDHWHRSGDVLPVVKFGHAKLIIGNYFNREFHIPLKAKGVASPSFFFLKYPFEVKDEVVLDVGAYLGDTPLLWLQKGAKKVVAVESVPLHFSFLQENTFGLPVECLNLSVGSRTPRLDFLEGSMSYGLAEADDIADFLDVDSVSLLELVNKYSATVVKLNCEGCEHFVIRDLLELRSLGVKKLVVDFHDFKGIDANTTYNFLRGKLGEGRIIYEKTKLVRLDKVKRLTVLWNW